MDCNIIRDLIPLYVDDCCSGESAKVVQAHMETCAACREIYERMCAPSEGSISSGAPLVMRKLRDWRASVLQSVLLFASFALIIAGVALEAATPIGQMNGFWACCLLIPVTGFMLSLANWYFVRNYKNRKNFSNASLFATLGFTVCGVFWAIFHYGMSMSELFSVQNLFCILLTAVFCILSKVLSNQYAKMLGKE